MLEVTSLSKTFDGFKAVNHANLTVEKGEIVAVIGPNGAGKTTLFNLITGIIKPDSGRVLFKGEDITGLPPYEVCRKRISRSFQIVNVFQRLTVFENVQISVLSREKKTWNLFTPSASLAIQETDEILESVGLLKKKDRATALLSHGDRKVLEIAMALGGTPNFLSSMNPPPAWPPERPPGALTSFKSSPGPWGLPSSSVNMTWRSSSGLPTALWLW